MVRRYGTGSIGGLIALTLCACASQRATRPSAELPAAYAHAAGREATSNRPDETAVFPNVGSSALVATARLAVPDFEQQQVELVAALALLLGRDPESFDVAEESLDDLLEPSTRAGLPSKLLPRRPDIIAAEDALRGAHAELLAAPTAFFPTLACRPPAGWRARQSTQPSMFSPGRAVRSGWARVW